MTGPTTTSVLLALAIAGLVSAQETVIGTWTGTWTLERADPLAEVSIPENLPVSLPVRFELRDEVVDPFFDTVGLVYVDSEMYGLAHPLRVSDAGELMGLMELSQGPRGSTASIVGTLIQDNRIEGTMVGAVCIDQGTCDRTITEPPFYYNRIGPLELTLVPEPTGVMHLWIAMVLPLNARRSRSHE